MTGLNFLYGCLGEGLRVYYNHGLAFLDEEAAASLTEDGR